MANETKDKTFQVNYKFAGPKGQLRTAAIIIVAETMEAANKMATESLTLQGLRYRITGTKQF